MSTSAPSPRESVLAIPPYVPGRPAQPRPGTRGYKLSSNENPYPPLPGVLAAAVRAAESLNRYPDAGCALLYEELGRRHGLPVSRLAAGAGSVGLLFHLMQAFCEPGDEVVLAWRSFEAYPIAAAAAGATARTVPLTPDGRHDLAAMAEAITPRTRVVLLCSPNNPTGPALSAAEVAGFLARVPDRVLVVLDEAYREFVRMPDPVDGPALAAADPRVVVMRTFSKAYGLAGLRVGYLIAAEEVASAIRACTIPFSVSTIAQAAAIASLDPSVQESLEGRVAALVGERERVVAGLADRGWQIPEPQGNFVWLPAAERTEELTAAAAADGLAVRPFTGEGVRVTIAEAAANDRFLALVGGPGGI